MQPTNEEILKLEKAILKKETSMLSANTLVPFGLVIGVASSIFFFGTVFQRLETAEKNITELKTSVKEELQSVRTELTNISNSIADLRVLLVQQSPNTSNKL